MSRSLDSSSARRELTAPEPVLELSSSVSWKTKGTPSALSCTSNSSPPRSDSRSCRAASRELPGALVPAPMCAMT
jgi:hypothetical protein